MVLNYQDFIRRKEVRFNPSGFTVATESINDKLFPFQKEIVRWSVERGRACVFAGCGLGKTAIQLEWANHVVNREKVKCLIVAPLAVTAQTQREGERFDVSVNICRSQNDVVDGINITNYESLHKFDASKFGAVVLDESSILKSYMGKTKRQLVQDFSATPYRLCCTATPAPNDLMELLNHAEFLGVMKSNEALALWFIADQSNSGHYILKGHAQKSFWEWVSTWAVVMDRPSDMGYSDDGYVLPPLTEINNIVEVDTTVGRKNGELVREVQSSATAYLTEKRYTMADRVQKCADIANASDEQIVIWCYLNEESVALAQSVQNSREVRGSHTQEYKEQAASDFIDGKFKVLISKPSIFGFGLNFQQCSTCIFCGLDYSFESYYQAVRRFYRFGQNRPVTVHRVVGATEFNILKTIEIKSNIRADMNTSMATYMKKLDRKKTEYFKSVDFTKQMFTMPKWLKSEERIKSC